MLISLFFLAFELPKTVTILKTFAGVPKPEYLALPYSMDTSPQGKLYVADRGQGRILVWNGDGSFDKGFGQTGEGPGEFTGIAKMAVTDEGVYVVDERARISIFDLAGAFRKTVIVPFRIRCFAVLDNDRFLCGFRSSSTPSGGQFRMAFEVFDSESGERHKVNDWLNESFLTPVEGDNNFHVKAYGPEVEIQNGPDGLIYFGFSQNKTVYTMDRTGKVLGSEVLPLVTGVPDEWDIEVNEDMTLPGPDGTRVQPSKIPNLKIHYEYEKAYYTHFLVEQDKITFVLTPLGGTDRSGNGYSQASFYVYDREQKKVVERGRYSFPEGSAVLYRDGRAMLFKVAAEGSYEIHEIALEGS